MSTSQSELNDRTIFFIHIMKTAGTSFRNMLEDAIGNQLYPCASDLEHNNKGWYLDNSELITSIDNKSLDLNTKKVVCGHYPFIIGARIINAPYHAVFLREPIDRTLSMIHHRKRRFPELQDLSISEILEDNIWVDQQLRNYQTKIFAINDLSLSSVNLPHTSTKDDYHRAASRMLKTEFVGITEQFNASINLFSKKTGITLSQIRSDNRGTYSKLSWRERKKIKSLVELDLLLYKQAKIKLVKDCQLHGIDIT